ncbi:hypothetical protein AJ87_22845 [Rhizobium yanglingense]|nr:hypothetical protein AJ87_22845 [Rhizobium yanglingense]
MRTDDTGRRFSREVKLAAVQRMAAGANVSKLARELGISRKGLYQWQKLLQQRQETPDAIHGRENCYRLLSHQRGAVTMSQE